jgi:hypothetical protein
MPIELSKKLDENVWLEDNHDILGRSPYVTEEFVAANLDVILAHKTNIAGNFCISIHFILARACGCISPRDACGCISPRDARGWNWNHISCRTDLTLDIIQANPTLPWDCDGLADNQNLTVDMIKLDVLKDLPWSYNEHISRMNGLHMRHIREEPSRNWNMRLVSRYAGGITAADINITSNNWDWRSLSYNCNISIEVIRATRSCSWDWDTLSERFDLDIIMNNLDLPWSRSGLCLNKQLDEKNIKILDKLIKETEHSCWDVFMILDNHPTFSYNYLKNLPRFPCQYSHEFRFMQLSCDMAAVGALANLHPGSEVIREVTAHNVFITDEYIAKRCDEFKKHLDLNEFLWDRRAYTFSIQRDIAARREHLCERLSEFVQPREFAAVIAHYVDYC